MQIFKCESLQMSKNKGMFIYNHASIKVCMYTGIQVKRFTNIELSTMQVWKHESFKT